MLRERAIPSLLAILLLLFSFTLVGCSVEQTEEGELPEVEVTEEGNLPEYDVDAADVEVTTEERTIEVPDVDIEPPADDDYEDDGDVAETDGTTEPPTGG